MSKMETKIRSIYNSVGKPILLVVFFICVGLFASWWIVLLLFIGWTGYKIYRGWPNIMMGAKQIEYILWGRPLEKEYWTKEQWANRPRFKLMPKDWKFEWIPSNISMGIDMKYRFALFMCIFGFLYFAIGFIFRYPLLGYFASIFYIGALFMSLFLLLQILAGAKIIYGRNKNRTRPTK